MIADAHVHFFSAGFYRMLAAARASGTPDEADGAVAIPARLGWTPPGADDALVAAWIAELDRTGVSRAMVIASVHGDESSVATAAGRHPSRLAGAFMLNPAAP